MEALLQSLTKLFDTGTDVILNLGLVLLPFIPLAVWIGVWLFAANWEKLWPVMTSGGLIGFVLIGLVMTLVWAAVAPPVDGVHHILGLKLSNFMGKFVFVTGLLCIMLLCGAVQRSGVCASWCRFEEEAPEDNLHAAMHGDDHGGH